MAKSTTFKGMPKPYGKSGHYYEPRRHALQAKGMKTGRLAEGVKGAYALTSYMNEKDWGTSIKAMEKGWQNPLTDIGKAIEQEAKRENKPIDKVAKKYHNFYFKKKPKDTDRDGVPDRFDCSPKDPAKQDDFRFKDVEEMAEPKEEKPEIEYEFGAEPDKTMEIEIEPSEIEIKKPSRDFMEKFESSIGGIMEGFAKEKEAKKERLHKKLAEELEEEAPEPEEKEFTGRSEVFGKILADIFGDYSSEELAELTDAELKELAVRVEAQGEGLLGKPYNIFKDEYIKRREAREKMRLTEKKMEAELEPLRRNIREEIEGIKTRTEKEDGLLKDIREFWGGK